MRKVDKRLLALYPHAVKLPVPRRGFGEQAEAIVGATTAIDHLAVPEAQVGRDVFVYRFRTPEDLARFRARLMAYDVVMEPDSDAAGETAAGPTTAPMAGRKSA